MIETVTVNRAKNIVLLRITNASGACVEFTNVGAGIVSAVVPDRRGSLSNVVLRYDRLEDYLTDSFYLGSTVGRFSNRISGGRFVLDGATWELDRNDGANSNHGGFNGFNRKIFDWCVDGEKVLFSTESPHGEGGFPGNLRVVVECAFDDENRLRLKYSAVADMRTPVNFTNHAYFNLFGTGGSAMGHLLRIEAERCLESDSDFLPTGRFVDVIGTAFDFTAHRPIGEMAALKQDCLRGYNAYFVAKNRTSGQNLPSGQDLPPLASLKEPASGRVLDVYSSMPGILLYTGDFLSAPFVPFGGVCLEAQYMPDGVNRPGFETNILSPGVEKTDTIIYAFGVE